MAVQLQLKNGILTAFLEGEIDHHTARIIREEIDTTAEKIRPAILKLDFTSITFMDSSGIGLIIGRCKLLASWSGKVIVCNVSKPIASIVSLAGLRQLCEIRGIENEKSNK